MCSRGPWCFIGVSLGSSIILLGHILWNVRSHAFHFLLQLVLRVRGSCMAPAPLAGAFWLPFVSKG